MSKSKPQGHSNVWRIAEETQRPLPVVVFQAVQLGAWTPGGAIDADWAESLSQVLRQEHPELRRKAAKPSAKPPLEGRVAAFLLDRDASALKTPLPMATLCDELGTTADETHDAVASLGDAVTYDEARQAVVVNLPRVALLRDAAIRAK